MAFENINFGMLPQAEMQQQQMLLNQLSQGIANRQRQQEIDLRQRQIEWEMNKPPPFDMTKDVQRIAVKAASGEPLTPQEQAIVQGYDYIQATKPAVLDAEGRPMPRGSLAEMLSGRPQASLEQRLDNSPAAIAQAMGVPEGDMMNQLGQTRQQLATQNADVSNVEPVLNVPQIEVSGSPFEQKEKKAANIDIQKQAAIGEIEESKKRQQMEDGKKVLDKTLSTMISKIDEIEKMGGGTSTQKSLAENILAYGKATGIGQEIGKMSGSKEQEKLNVINSSKRLLMPQIMKATGMSAKQMDSNTEFKAYMEALSDPTATLETQKEVLRNLSNAFGGGNLSGNEQPKEQPTKPTSWQEYFQ